MKTFLLNSLFLFLFASCSQESGFHTLGSLSTQSLASGESSHSNSSHSNNSHSKNSHSNRVVENFKMNTQVAIIDFLIQPDSSSSMAPHLKNLGQSLSSLLSVISDYDWQMAFSSVDHGDHQFKNNYQNDWRDHIAQGQGRFGSLMNLENGSHFLSTTILSPRLSNYENIFLHTLSHVEDVNCQRPPFCSNSMEQPLRSLKSVIERAFLSNKALFRDSSKYFVSILISNEDERQEDSRRATTPDEVITSFNEQFKGLDKKFLHYSIVIDSQECLNQERKKSPVAQISSASISLSEKTAGPGAVMSLCSKDYSSGLSQISHHIKNKVENSFVLKTEPVPDSVELSFAGESAVEWTLKGREILFDNKNNQNIQGTISYEALK